MRTVRRVKTYLSPKDASRLTRLAPTKLASLARRGMLTHYRTRGNHRRYDLDELHALRRLS